MNDKDNFALVRKPSNEVEKSAPHAKRILSGIVADTLALAKKEKKRQEREAYAAMLRAIPAGVLQKMPRMVSVPSKPREKPADETV